MTEISEMTDIKDVQLRTTYWNMHLKQVRKEVEPLNEEIKRGERELVRLRQQGNIICYNDDPDSE